MQKRRLGRTGLYVTPISFGALPVQRCNMEEAGAVIKAVLDAGINFIDTGRVYSDSEEKLGRWAAGRRAEYYLATKSMARDKANMAKEINTSLELMKTDYIDLYQVHNVRTIEELKQVLSAGGALEALKEARTAGKVGHFGITGHNIALLVEAVKTNEFSTVQAPFNAIETGALKELLPATKALDIGFIAMKPLAGGVLPLADLALRFILGHDISVAIPGMDKVEQVEENLVAARLERQLSAEELTYLQQEAAKLGADFCRRCGYCLPCSAGIDIPTVFVFHFQYMHYKLHTIAKSRYDKLPIKADACNGCGKCEERCPYQLPIKKRMAAIARELS